MIRFLSDWTYRTPLVTISYAEGWEGEPDPAIVKAALDAGAAERVVEEAAADDE